MPIEAQVSRSSPPLRIMGATSTAAGRPVKLPAVTTAATHGRESIDNQTLTRGGFARMGLHRSVQGNVRTQRR